MVTHQGHFYPRGDTQLIRIRESQSEKISGNPKNINLASLQPKTISSFYTLTPVNEQEISGSNANGGHECL